MYKKKNKPREISCCVIFSTCQVPVILSMRQTVTEFITLSKYYCFCCCMLGEFMHCVSPVWLQFLLQCANYTGQLERVSADEKQL